MRSTLPAWRLNIGNKLRDWSVPGERGIDRGRSHMAAL